MYADFTTHVLAGIGALTVLWYLFKALGWIGDVFIRGIGDKHRDPGP